MWGWQLGLGTQQPGELSNLAHGEGSNGGSDEYKSCYLVPGLSGQWHQAEREDRGSTTA